MWIHHGLRHAASAMDLRDIGEPARAPGEVPNYASRMLWAIWAFTFASAVLLGLRVYCKLSRRRPLWWDDHFLIASWVSNIDVFSSELRLPRDPANRGVAYKITILISSAMLTEATKYGLGMHWEDMDYTKIPTISWLSYVAGFCTVLGTAWSKTSFAITILRLPSSKWIKWLVWFIIISVNIVLGFTAATMFISCWPVAKTWYSDMEGTCWPHYIVQNYQTFASGTWL